MRVRIRRFLRLAAPLPSREQMVVFLRGALVQLKMRRAHQRARIKQGRYARNRALTFAVSNNVGVEKSRKYFRINGLLPMVRSERPVPLNSQANMIEIICIFKSKPKTSYHSMYLKLYPNQCTADAIISRIANVAATPRMPLASVGHGWPHLSLPQIKS
jgi:hypothetical protein